jgi:hypothetical protein
MIDRAGRARRVQQITGTFVFDESSALEQTLVTVPITIRSDIGGIWLDMVNVTRATTIRVKHQIDGVNYRTSETEAWTVALDDGVLLTGVRAAHHNIQVSLQCDGLGAGVVNVPFGVV